VVFEVLLVCQANVCRSPAAAALFEQRMQSTALAGSLAFVSAGVHPASSAGWCRSALAYVRRRGCQPDQDRPPRRCDPGLVESADLLLAMSRRERAAIVRLVPTAGPRTFTLVEAAALADAVLDELLGSDAPEFVSWLGLSEPPTGGPATDRLEWLVREMNAARGLVRLSSAEQRHRWSRREPAPPDIDIEDVHDSRRASHRRTLSRLSQEIGRFSEALLQVSEPHPRHADSES
jgi:protein-tyrosine-phosphatase